MAKIQPVRVIACSGTITVLRHGLGERVICRYLDGREEEIPVEQYQEKASISSEAAQENRIDELLNSDLEEIIFEHPNLDLCRNGVEIVDSPGLNEHPARTAITQQSIDRADAIVFLIHA
ncbi:MAG: Dynamin family protein, partial [Pseudanabaena sp. SU_2_4]|nr:Dynamin family protein [Pseudanabaena sp. SU_2_4]